MMIDLPEPDKIVSASKPRPRGFIEWRPNDNTLELLADVQTVLAEYREFLPLTARQIFYRLVGTVGYGKTERDYKRLTECLNKARRAQLISFSAIRDDGTTTNIAPGAESEGQSAAWMRSIARQGLNLQVDQPVRQIVLCEAGGMVPQLARVAHRFGVSVISAGGFNSLTDKHELASDLADDGRPTILWHVGDFDPSGVHVFQSLSEDVSEFAASFGAKDVVFKRLAVDEIQIAAHQLPTAPAKRTDNRSFDGAGTVQAEALPPEVLANILRERLDQFFDYDVAAKIGERSVEIFTLFNEAFELERWDTSNDH